jgi:hypothetical protein
MSDCWLDSFFVKLDLGVDHQTLRQIYRLAIECDSIYRQYISRNLPIDQWRSKSEHFWSIVVRLLPNLSNFERRQLVETILPADLLAVVTIAAPAI